VTARRQRVWAAVLALSTWPAGLAWARDGVSSAPSPAITLRVVGSRDEARSMRETLADLLSRAGIDIAAEPAAAVLVDVTVDLSGGTGGPFVELTTREPPSTIGRRQLDASVSRDVLIETAAQVVYTAVETRARTQGLIAGGTGGLGDPASAAASSGGAPPIAPLQTGGAADLRAQAPVPVRAASYGVDVAALAETRIQRLDPSRPTAGGGLALTWASRRRALGPALTAAFEVQRPVAAGDPDTAAHLTTISVRLIPTIDAIARRWTTLQVGPSLAFDVSRGDAPVFAGNPLSPQMTGGGGPPGAPAGGPAPVAGATGPMTGPIGAPGPAATGGLPAGSAGGPPAGAASGFSALALSAGGFARWSVRIGRHAQLFAAAGVERRLTYAGSSRPSAGQGPNAGDPAAGPGGASSWRSSLLAGIAFTVAGAPTCACFAGAAPGRE